MLTQQFRALVVDDSQIVRTTLGRALEREEFHCAYASDSAEAKMRLEGETFDLVVTDLRMPNGNGHALAVEILSRPRAPLVAVHTAVTDSRLTNDLLARGVDSVVYKPTDLKGFAIRMKERIRVRRLAMTGNSECLCGDAKSADRSVALPIQRINGGEYERRIANVNQMFPLSLETNDVYQLSCDPSTVPNRFVSRVLQDAALTAEVLRIANSPFYLRTNAPTIDIDEAVARLGYRRVGEIALTLNVSAMLRSRVLPWLDADLTQRRSIAASIAFSCITEFCPKAIVDDALTLSAFLAPLGRLMMGIAFHAEYEVLIKYSLQSGHALSELEPHIFPEDPTTALSRVISKWGLSENVWRPLRHVTENIEQTDLLDEPLRSTVELLKVGIFAGESAVGRWLPWEKIPSTPEHVFFKYRLNPASQIIERTKTKLENLTLSPHGTAKGAAAPADRRRDRIHPTR